MKKKNSPAVLNPCGFCFIKKLPPAASFKKWAEVPAGVGCGLFFVEYDANGNLIFDSDRKILQIQYNLLNLPSQIFFENGNVIVNIYASNGMKLETRYITQITQDLSPIEKTLENISNIQAMSGKVYAGNVEYKYNDMNRDLILSMVSNAEGYVADNGYFYYRKDYLGNNREVVRFPLSCGEGAGGEVVQITNYYPSGLPWAYNAGSGAAVQPYKYNGKEFIEENGLDTYDYGARGYYAAIGRFTQIDPMAEHNYSFSPYSYANCNPVRYIDVLGLSAYTTSDPDEIAALMNHLGSGGSLDDYDFKEWEDITELIENDLCKTRIDWILSGGGGGMTGGSDGGRRPVPNATPYTPADGDKFWNNMTQAEIEEFLKDEEFKKKFSSSSIGGNIIYSDDYTCFTRSMSLANALLGGVKNKKGLYKRDEEFFRYEYFGGIIPLFDPKFKGVKTGDDGKRGYEFLSKYFTIGSDIKNLNLKDVIDNGALALVSKDCKGIGLHAILVVGYQNSGLSIIFYDSTFSSLWTLPSNNFANQYSYKITGIK